MNNELKFQHIKRLWYLEGSVIKTRHGNRPIKFRPDRKGYLATDTQCGEKKFRIMQHEALFMLFHARPIAEGKEIHHRDGNHENNAITNLVELTRTQHKRIHAYQCNDPMRGIRLDQGAWRFQWMGDDGKLHRSRCFHTINDAMAFRAEIEEPRRAELRALGLNCRKISRGITASQLRKISRQQNTRLWRAHI